MIAKPLESDQNDGRTSHMINNPLCSKASLQMGQRSNGAEIRVMQCISLPPIFL